MISKLNSLIVDPFPLKNLFFGRALDVAPIGFYIIQNIKKMKKIWGLKKKRSKVFSSKILKQNITILFFFFLCFLPCSFAFGVFKKNLIFQFALSMI